MQTPMTAAQALDRYFLEMRCKVLDVAAALDRLDRGGSSPVGQDARIENLRKAAQVLFDGQGDRAARIQMLFSDPYDPAWPRPEK